MKFELCTDSLEGAKMAQHYGLDRIELCSALSVGGLTPSYGLVTSCVQHTTVEVHVMIRNREGDFYYNEAELKMMERDIEMVAKAGASGVVFGVLTKDNKISDTNLRLIKVAKALGLEVTFHRAFDYIEDYHSAIRQLIVWRVDRLLTSGLAATAIEGIHVLKELQEKYGHQIQLLPGSGVAPSNALILAEAGMRQLHFRAGKATEKKDVFQMGENQITDTNKMEAVLALFG